jgi:perosamine synthetase
MDREAFMAFLQEKNIGSAVHYPMPVHMQPLYRDSAREAHCPVSEMLSKQVLSLPVHPGVTTEDCAYICDIINEVN